MTSDEHIRTARESYDRDSLIESSVARDPIVQFEQWMSDAIAAGVPEPNAMTLASVDATGRPSARIVLLRGFDDRGFVFYTNYESRKGHELALNQAAALVFFWPQLHRQVRVEGRARPLGAPESDAYFATRPRGHRLSAWASRQSAPVADRDELERAMHEAEERFAGRDVERPAHWGGYVLAPDAIEFWQGRPNRVHDRLAFTLDGARWVMSRLAP